MARDGHQDHGGGRSGTFPIPNTTGRRQTHAFPASFRRPEAGRAVHQDLNFFQIGARKSADYITDTASVISRSCSASPFWTCPMLVITVEWSRQKISPIF